MRPGPFTAAALSLVLAGPVQADDWMLLDGPAIEAALEARTVDYEDANGTWQRFYASGRTLYNAGRDSWGYWAVRGDQYCSQWPPGDLWACYDFAVNGDRIRFISDEGGITEGRYRRD